MSVIVTDTGYGPDDWTGVTVTPDHEPTGQDLHALALDLPCDTPPEALDRTVLGFGMIRVDFPSFADGRGFTIARQLRRMGYGGRLRARGHVLADQYAMARRCGFDEVEISTAMAARQPQSAWIARADWDQPHYQSILAAAQ